MEKTTSSVMWSSKSFRWSIGNFSDICGLRSNDSDNEINAPIVQSSQEYNCLLDIDFLQSPIIDVGSEESQSQWLVRLMKSVEDENSIDLYMELAQIGSELEGEDAPEQSECFFKYRINIIGCNGESYLKKTGNKIIYLKSGRSWREPGLIRVDHLKDHVDQVLVDDTLNLQIDLFVLNDLHHSKIDGLSMQADASLPAKKRKHSSVCDLQEVLNSSQLKIAKQVFNNLWKTRINSDIQIECGESHFPVHKSILSSCSPVFSAAFTHDMCENSENRIVINDISPKIMETVLRFIYCDANPDEAHWRNVDDLAELLNAAEKYQITTLKFLCFSKLCEELTLNNAAQITSLVYLFEPEESIKQFVHKYVIGNINILKDMGSFKKKLNEMPAAFAPILLLVGD